MPLKTKKQSSKTILKINEILEDITDKEITLERQFTREKELFRRNEDYPVNKIIKLAEDLELLGKQRNQLLQKRVYEMITYVSYN